MTPPQLRVVPVTPQRTPTCPQAHGTAPLRLATPVGARELAALSLTCKSLYATLSTEARWAPFLQLLEKFSQPWEGQDHTHGSHSREEGQGYRIPEYAGPPVYVGRTFINDTALVPFVEADMAPSWDHPSIAHFVEREGEDGVAGDLVLERLFYLAQPAPVRDQFGRLRPESCISIWIEQDPPFRCPLNACTMGTALGDGMACQTLIATSSDAV